MFIWAAHLCVEVACKPGASEYQKQRSCLAYSLLKYVYICSDADIFFTEQEADSAQYFGQCFLLWYQELAFQAYTQGRTYWKLRPKLHYFAHTILEIGDTRENPAKQALWGAEDLVGQIKKLGKRCSKRTASNRISERRGLFLCLRARKADLMRKLCVKKKLK